MGSARTLIKAAAVGAALSWGQVAVALAIGVLAFDRRFDAGADDDWLLNWRTTLWLSATSVIVAAAVTRADGPWRKRLRVGEAAAVGSGTVVVLVLGRASAASHVHLVADPADSAAKAVVAGACLGVVAIVIAGTTRAVLVGAVTGAALIWIMLAASADAAPPALGGLDLAGLDFRGRLNLLQASALALGPVVATAVVLLARREAARPLIHGGLLSVSTVAAAIVVTAIIGPTPSGDHLDPGLAVLVPLLIGGVAGYGILATAARNRRRHLPTVSAA